VSDGQILLGGVFALFMLVAIVTLIATHEAKKRRPNIRVPRETLWARTQKYHGVQK
jgi:hypothetical protein